MANEVTDDEDKSGAKRRANIAQLVCSSVYLRTLIDSCAI